MLPVHRRKWDIYVLFLDTRFKKRTCPLKKGHMNIVKEKTKSRVTGEYAHILRYVM